ncbi:hypothetical protein MB84_10265 [Pandoraea oxalativorans]|uniref:Uncharacterized protein n=2 Tax=Pandoraea oxalativorans TaxID=573737 RepID=A0A0E3YCG3_9BURK|nr:hypothetical protein MB84_10265 [Pandoraea oxalativorans]
MTLRGGNPQALMLPSQCLHHYHVDPHADAAPAQEAARTGVLTRAGQWLRAFVRDRKPRQHG